jgi:hypothetical protein
MQAPDWHGRNLDALDDSWVAGGVCAAGPPFRFVIRSAAHPEPALASFTTAVLEIAQASVRENGGNVTVSPVV